MPKGIRCQYGSGQKALDKDACAHVFSVTASSFSVECAWRVKAHPTCLRACGLVCPEACTQQESAYFQFGASTTVQACSASSLVMQEAAACYQARILVSQASDKLTASQFLAACQLAASGHPLPTPLLHLLSPHSFLAVLELLLQLLTPLCLCLVIPLHHFAIALALPLPHSPCLMP